MKCMQWARVAETPCHELVWCGYWCAGVRAGCAIGANVIADGGEREVLFVKLLTKHGSMWVVVREAKVLFVVFLEERDVRGRWYVPTGRARCLDVQGLCRGLCVQCSFLSIKIEDKRGMLCRCDNET